MQRTKILFLTVGTWYGLVEVHAVLIVGVEIVTSYPGDFSILLMLTQAGNIIVSVS